MLRSVPRWLSTFTETAVAPNCTSRALLDYFTIGGYGITRYNGGTEVDGKWYQGIERPLPQVAEGYEIVVKPTWGWQIIKKETP